MRTRVVRVRLHPFPTPDSTWAVPNEGQSHVAKARRVFVFGVPHKFNLFIANGKGLQIARKKSI